LGRDRLRFVPPRRETPAIRSTILQFSFGTSGVMVEHVSFGRRATHGKAPRRQSDSAHVRRRATVTRRTSPIFHIPAVGHALITLCERGYSMKTIARLCVHRCRITERRQTQEQHHPAEAFHDFSVVIRLRNVTSLSILNLTDCLTILLRRTRKQARGHLTSFPGDCNCRRSRDDSDQGL
jgi:hypothetical protein